MRTSIALASLAAALLLSACRGPDREWMKVNQPYTAEEFRRDVADCTRGGSLDEACMKSRGWVSVTAPRTTKPQEPLRAPAGARPR